MSTYRYCVLWIPTRLHQKIRPVSYELEGREDEQFDREYKTDQDGFILINESISLKNILASDDAHKKVYLDFTLLKEGEGLSCKTENEFAGSNCSCFIPKRDIQIKARLEDGTVFDTLYLHCLDARRNGLFMYEYEVQSKYLKERNNEDNYLLNSNKNVTNILYHSIKSFYHVHEFHNGVQDSIIHPFSSDVIIDLNSPNNPALLHYLDEFEKIFTDEDEYTIFLKVQADKVYQDEISKGVDSNFDNDGIKSGKAIERIKTGYIECINQCDKILNMHIYYQALFYSKHNTIFNLRYIDSYKYELSEECQITGKKRKSALTLKTCNNSTNPPQLLVPNRFEKSVPYVLSNECYKKAINIHNAIESISLRQKQVSNHVNWIFLKYINNLMDKLCEQSLKLKRQTDDIQALTKETGELSSKLTRRTTFLGIVVGIISSFFFYMLSSYSTYTPEDDLKALNDSLISTRNLLQKQVDVRNQQIEEVKKLLIDLNSKVKKKQEDKKSPSKITPVASTVTPKKQ